MADSTLRRDSVGANPTKQSPNLRIAISTALRRHGIPPSRFGRDAVNDPAFYRDLMHRGRELRPATAARVRAFIAALDGEV